MENISNDDTNPHFEENKNSLVDLTFIDSDHLPNTISQSILMLLINR